ncbi:hypothetical protein CPC08DRAFT_625449, partial [Agrocybe pediades]
IPPPEDIVKICHEHDKEQLNAPLTVFPVTGFPLKSKTGSEIAWVKHGSDICLAEAAMQHCVFKNFQSLGIPKVRAPAVYLAFGDGRYGYIVMEFIRGVSCKRSDAPLVATAVQAIIELTIDSGVPGPLPKGPIRHPFFIEWKASRCYDSVKDLQDYINRILAIGRRTSRVDFTDEVAAHGLHLCPADIHPGNFLKDESGDVVVIDFGCFSFLPLSFLEYAFQYCIQQYPFAESVRKRLRLPKATQVYQLSIAHQVLVPFNKNI